MLNLGAMFSQRLFGVSLGGLGLILLTGAGVAYVGLYIAKLKLETKLKVAPHHAYTERTLLETVDKISVDYKWVMVASAAIGGLLSLTLIFNSRQEPISKISLHRYEVVAILLILFGLGAASIGGIWSYRLADAVRRGNQQESASEFLVGSAIFKWRSNRPIAMIIIGTGLGCAIVGRVLLASVNRKTAKFEEDAEIPDEDSHLRAASRLAEKR